MGAVKGCCCGMVAGILLILILAGAAGFGIYLWMNPEARSGFVEKLDHGWGAAKDGGDKVMSEVKQVSGEMPAPPSVPPAKVTPGIPTAN